MQFIADPEAFHAAEAKAAEDALTNKDKLLSAAAAASDALEALGRLASDAREELIAAVEDDEIPSSEQKVEVSETPVTAEPFVEATPKYSPPASIYDRIERHLKATGKKPSAEEVRWILANWTDGPVLLFLNDNFQRFRAAQQPMFEVLDVNRDRVISGDEIENAVAAITSCDLNRDEVVDATEIGKVASDPRNVRSLSAASRPMIARLDQREYVRMVLSKLTACYAVDPSSDTLSAFDQNRDGVLDDPEFHDIQNRPADLSLNIVFNTKASTVSRLSITGAADEHQSAMSSAKKTDGTIVLPFPEFQLEISSVQGAASDQISIGAIDDGYALLPELDENGDDRFTIRELRTLTERLKSFDRDNNGSIDFDEIVPTYRLCIALGPNAHEPLSVLRQRKALVTEPVTGPDWFTEMDKNKDLDLTRTEFPGTDEQFQQLDEDGDGLIDVHEAADG
jgi:Ca2+-binding EF-hand superfamily protein